MFQRSKTRKPAVQPQCAAIVTSTHTVADEKGVAALLDEYLTFLQHHRGLRESTLYFQRRWGDAFLRYLVKHFPDHDLAHLTIPVIDEFVLPLAQVCVFRARANPAAFIPDAIRCPRVTPRFRPYIYSEREIRALIKAAASLSGTLRPHTYVTLLLVLYTTGLRIGEAIRLQLGDLNRDQAVLHIRAGKFRKARLVPITRTLGDRLDMYLERRQQAGAPTHADAPLFWSPRGGPYSLIGVQSGISDLLRAVCGKRRGRGSGPRVHDLRHAFAVHRLLRWYRDGVDVQTKLPLLATYLGHCTFLSTQYYLTATPELLAEASRRFHAGFASVVRLPEVHDDIR
jgi:integrase/recombinase XerD